MKSRSSKLHAATVAWLSEPQTIAAVWWTDSAMHGDSVSEADDPSLGPVEGFSVGVVVRDDDRGLTLAMDAWETLDYRHMQSILKRQINRVEYYKVKAGGGRAKALLTPTTRKRNV